MNGPTHTDDEGPPVYGLVGYGLGALCALGLVAIFGLLFPVFGALIWFFGISPPGEDPLGPALGMIVAGPLTALFYLPGGIACLVALRGLQTDASWALSAGILAALTTAFICPPFGALAVIAGLAATINRRSASSPSGEREALPEQG